MEAAAQKRERQIVSRQTANGSFTSNSGRWPKPPLLAGQVKAVIQKFMVLGAPMSLDGRLPELTNGRSVEAKPEKFRLIVGPLWSEPNDKFGSGGELPLFKFIAVKLPLEFRFPEAAVVH